VENLEILEKIPLVIIYLIYIRLAWFGFMQIKRSWICNASGTS